MTTANPQHARPGGLARAWRGFRRWRRARPFWGGLLTALAGVEIFLTTQMSLGGLSFQMGPTGFLSWLIPTMLVSCGMLMWFSPQQRMFYAIVGAMTAVFSLIAVNLGGFFIGMLLGMVGGALGFAWAPTVVRRAPGADADGPGADADGPGTEVDGPGTDAPTFADAPAVDGPTFVDGPAVDASHGRQDQAPDRYPGQAAQPHSGYHQEGRVAEPPPPTTAADRTPGRPLFTVLLVLLSIAAGGLVTARTGTPAQAAPGCTPTTRPTPSTSAAPTGTPTPSPTASAPAGGEEVEDGNLITDIVAGVQRLFTGGQEQNGTDPAVTPTPTASAPGSGPTTAPTGKPAATATTAPTRRPLPGGTSGPQRCRPGGPVSPAPVEPGKPLPRIAVDPGQPLVAKKPGRLTGTKVIMTALRFEGVVELPTVDGPLRALKFTMSRAVTDDFQLDVDGPLTKTMRYRTGALTVQGDVSFYTTRFVGRFLGIRVTLTPDLPLPDGIPITSPLPLTFTEPVIDLAYLDCDQLSVEPTLKLNLV
ncbi:DUF6114 domain-containing protein [Micromonospora sp. CPCC 206060]|uniref:DUF6114 domain-containing protein n=1 Tax=Micromonospora sp. CPCC 206060 TaxID=3122406 RepID=UPI002FF18117